MLSQDAEIAINYALYDAQQRRHEYATVEHLLLGLVHDRATRRVIRGAGGNADRVRDDLVAYLEGEVEAILEENFTRTELSIGFRRVINRAIAHLQSSGKEQVEGANLLVATLLSASGLDKIATIETRRR